MTENDYFYVFDILFILCLIGLVYIFIMIISIAFMTTKHNIKEIRREVDIRMNHMNDKRIYERNENVMTNKANKPFEQIYHSCKTIDKTYPKQYLLLETIVEINDTKEYSDKQNIDDNQLVSDSGRQYVRESYKKLTKTVKFDSKGKIIKEIITKETLNPIELIEPLNEEVIKCDTIVANIPIKVERNRIHVQIEESFIESKTECNENIVLDVVSYANSSTPALLISSQTNQMTTFMANTKPVLTSHTLISNVELKEIKGLANNIDVNEIPTIESHLQITEVPVYRNDTRIEERVTRTQRSGTVSTDIVEAEVPVLMQTITTKTRIPAFIPISIRKTQCFKHF